ncbi:hypothetical protein SDC9_94457 [bioreactor metagenome]|uniref:Uncharacterized protein n=1 Tax=bioreactor metagenome TaxID=1076179 RepID=A0A645AA90_9ZZZZ
MVGEESGLAVTLKRLPPDEAARLAATPVPEPIATAVPESVPVSQNLAGSWKGEAAGAPIAITLSPDGKIGIVQAEGVRTGSYASDLSAITVSFEDGTALTYRFILMGDTLLLTDEQIFKGAPPAVTGIKLYGDETLESSVICAASIAVTLGMPLGAAFLQLLDGRMDRLGAVTEIKYQDELGLYSFMNGNVIAMGDGEFMKQNMIRLPRDGAGERIRKNGDYPLYLAVGGRLAAIFAVRYDLTKSTASALKALVTTGVGLLVATNDPLLTAPVILQLLGQKQADVRILPSRNRDELELAPAVSEKVTALLGRRDPMALAKCVSGAVRIRNAAAAGTAVGALSMAASALLLLFAAKNGIVAAVSPFFYPLYGLVWMLPTVCIAFITARIIGK